MRAAFASASSAAFVRSFSSSISSVASLAAASILSSSARSLALARSETEERRESDAALRLAISSRSLCNLSSRSLSLSALTVSSSFFLPFAAPRLSRSLVRKLAAYSISALFFARAALARSASSRRRASSSAALALSALSASARRRFSSARRARASARASSSDLAADESLSCMVSVPAEPSRVSPSAFVLFSSIFPPWERSVALPVKFENVIQHLATKDNADKASAIVDYRNEVVLLYVFDKILHRRAVEQRL